MTKHKYIAKTFANLEPLLKKELENLGAENVTELSRAVQFEGDLELLYKVNYFSRLSLRVLWQIHTFTFENNNQFYNELFKFPIEDYLSVDQTFAINTTANKTIFKTPLFASLLAKDAICDRFRDFENKRPSIDKEFPNVEFNLYIYQGEATLFVNSSGESLHKRGYKASNHPAAINEVLAAGMIQFSNWKCDTDFIDFTCGSGTLLIEAAMLALNIPAGFYRNHFGFYKWKNFDRALWTKVTESAEIKNDVPIDFWGSDVSKRYLGMARINVQEARLGGFVKLFLKDLKDTKPKNTPAFVMINPPYGERLELDDIHQLYQEIGDTLKNNYCDCKAFIISSDKDALQSVGLKYTKKKILYNGKLECQFLSYDLWKKQ